jgi:hypothetical protein
MKDGKLRGVLSLVVAPLTWALHHQLGSNLAFAACEQSTPRTTLIVGVGALALIAWVGGIAWSAWRRKHDALGMSTEELDVFIPLLGWMAALLFGLTILVQLLANVLLPPCFG